MTDAEKQQKKDAEEDAKLLLLLLLAGGTGVTFNKTLGRFYVNGKSVSVNTIRGYLLRIERRTARRIGKLVDKLEAGEITIDEWEKEFNRHISSIHILAGALVLGSIAAAVLDNEIQKQIKIQQKYGQRFTKQIKKKKAGTWVRIKARAKSYTRAANITFAKIQLKVRALFQTECRRILRASESCSGCLALEGIWLPIKEMPPIGSLDGPGECMHYCRCYLEFR